MNSSPKSDHAVQSHGVSRCQGGGRETKLEVVIPVIVMKSAPRSNRRRFLRGSLLTTAGLVVAATDLVPAGPVGEAPAVDPELAGVLQSYGQVLKVAEGGRQTVRVGKRQRSLPVSRLRVEVADRDAFQQSFGALTRLNDRILVSQNEVSLVRGGRYLVIDNRVA